MCFEIKGRNIIGNNTVALIKSGEIINRQYAAPHKAHTIDVNWFLWLFSWIKEELILENNLKWVTAIVKANAKEMNNLRFSIMTNSEFNIMCPRNPARYAIPNKGIR